MVHSDVAVLGTEVTSSLSLASGTIFGQNYITEVPSPVHSAAAAQQGCCLACLLSAPCPVYGEPGQILTPLMAPWGLAWHRYCLGQQ